MRLHVSLDDELVRELDRRVGARGRSAYIAKAVRRALDDERRWDEVAASVGSIGMGHDWDEHPEVWVRDGRATDSRRVG